MSTDLDDIVDRIHAWRAAGQGVALATVVRTWGSSPRPVGSHLAVNSDGDFAGSVSGGCVEGAVIREAQATIVDGQLRLLKFGVADDQAWEVGLACGGNIEVFVERLHTAFVDLWAARTLQRAVAVVTRLHDGAHAAVGADSVSGELELSDAVVAQVRQCSTTGTSRMLDEAGTLFTRVYAPCPRLLIVGAVHIAEALTSMAMMAGYRVTIIEPRRAFARVARFAGVEFIDEWPDEAIQRLAPDAQTAVVTLTHDPKLDDAALAMALASPAFYIGALGSSRTHAKRIDRLARLGPASQLGRIHAPIGLDLGGRHPAEIAIAILAEIIRVRYQGSVV